MTIPTLPTPPSTSSPLTFDILADAFIEALPAWTDAVNDLVPALNTIPAAATAASNAYASSNYKGDWSTLTGSLAIPASVSHIGSVWMLVSNTGDVTSIVPGTSSQWLILNPDDSPLWSLIWS